MSVHGWYVGQRIVCVEGRFHKGVCEWCFSVPVTGHQYTIRRIQFGRDAYTDETGLGFLLEEIVNPRKPDGGESGFFSDRFRPLWDAEHIAEQKDTCPCVET